MFVVYFLLFASLNAVTLQKANLYKDQNISGWVMSEKLDGIRAYWDGKTLQTRKGQEIHAPEWFVKNLPPFALDGELWSKRSDFENIQSIVVDDKPSEKWKEISYMIFEVPSAEGNFTTRLQKAHNYISANKLSHLKIIEQKVCSSQTQLDAYLQQVIKNGGEGVMVKDGSKAYFEGRSDSLLKVKESQDMEAEVIGYKAGEGKFKGLMGSLQVKLENGVEFFIGSGFSDALRQNPPKIGEIITFKYFGFTKFGKPKFASFVHVRKD
ncbi:MAG: DNA ligase [Sulfurimonas sp. GWF2_37_8]|nr:MAG: DNA ligase [Sulfurimonas sp. GWF2_37_8]